MNIVSPVGMHTVVTVYTEHSLPHMQLLPVIMKCDCQVHFGNEFKRVFTLGGATSIVILYTWGCSMPEFRKVRGRVWDSNFV